MRPRRDKLVACTSIAYWPYLGQYLSYYIQTEHDGRLTLMLVSMTLTMMQGHKGAAKAKKISFELSRQLSKAISIKRATTVGYFFIYLRDLNFANVYMA